MLFAERNIRRKPLTNSQNRNRIARSTLALAIDLAQSQDRRGRHEAYSFLVIVQQRRQLANLALTGEFAQSLGGSSSYRPIFILQGIVQFARSFFARVRCQDRRSNSARRRSLVLALGKLCSRRNPIRQRPK